MATIFVIDPHSIVRAGVRSILGDRHVIAGEADDAPQGVARLAASLEPVDLVIIDANGSADAVDLLAQSFPHLRIVLYQDSALAGEEQPHAFVSKRREATRLRTAVEAVLRGDVFHDPVEARPHDRLSPREREVLGMVMGGMRPKEIALELNVSVKTISTHRFRIMRKLGVDNDVTLMRYAFRNALAGL